MNKAPKAVTGEGDAPRVIDPSVNAVFELTDGTEVFKTQQFASTSDWKNANDEAYRATDGNLFWRLR